MNAAPLMSAHWFRIAKAKPQLDPQLALRRIVYRGQVWHVLARPDGRQSFRLDANAYAFVGRCDGTRTAQQLWEVLLAERKDAAPTQDGLLRLLARLQAAGLIGFDGAAPLVEAEPEARRPSRDQAGANTPLSFRIPLGRPDAWVGRIAPRLSALFTPTAFALWLLLVAAGGVAALLNVDAIAAHARLWLGTPRMLLLLWLAYPVVKALHEFAHALAVKHYGGVLPEWGVAIVMFTPMPYVDASAASAFPRAARRALVAAAGIMVELALAALALAVALAVEPGLVRDTAFGVFWIGAVSSLLVNGNPLLRFDGYHVLCDALALPNLAQRSARHWLTVLRRRLLGLPNESALQPAPGEAKWLWAYAPLAFAYRLGIGAALVFWLGGISFVLGGAVALYLAWLLAAKPLAALWRFVRGPMLADTERARATRRVLAGAAVAALLFSALPLPFASVAQGVLWLPERALLRAGGDGFVEVIHVADGERVHAGQVVFSLSAPRLAAERVRLEGRIDALETERLQSVRDDPAKAAGIEEELASAQAELARTDERIAQLEVRAGCDGTAVITHADDLRGRFVKQGALLAHVLGLDASIVRVALPQDEAALVRAASRALAVRGADGETRAGELLRDVSGAAAKLPSAALGSNSGGAILTDPRDPEGLTPAQGIVLADVRLEGAPAERIGARAWVRFDHGYATLAAQLARRVRQLFLQRFNPAA